MIIRFYPCHLTFTTRNPGITNKISQQKGFRYNLPTECRPLFVWNKFKQLATDYQLFTYQYLPTEYSIRKRWRQNFPLSYSDRIVNGLPTEILVTKYQQTCYDFSDGFSISNLVLSSSLFPLVIHCKSVKK